MNLVGPASLLSLQPFVALQILHSRPKVPSLLLLLLFIRDFAIYVLVVVSVFVLLVVLDVVVVVVIDSVLFYILALLSMLAL